MSAAASEVENTSGVTAKVFAMIRLGWVIHIYETDRHEVIGQAVESEAAPFAKQPTELLNPSTSVKNVVCHFFLPQLLFNGLGLLLYIGNRPTRNPTQPNSS